VVRRQYVGGVQPDRADLHQHHQDVREHCGEQRQEIVVRN